MWLFCWFSIDGKSVSILYFVFHKSITVCICVNYCIQECFNFTITEKHFKVEKLLLLFLITVQGCVQATKEQLFCRRGKVKSNYFLNWSKFIIVLKLSLSGMLFFM